MHSVYVLVLLNSDGSIKEMISAHPSKSVADSAERYYRTYTLTGFNKPDTDIIETNFEA